MLTRTLISMAVTAAFLSTATHAATTTLTYTDQQDVVYTDSLPDFQSITADASSVTFREAIGTPGSVFDTDNGTVSATNSSHLIFEKGLYTESSGYQKNGLSVSGGSVVEIHEGASFKVSGSQGDALSVTQDSTLRFVDAETIEVSSSGYQSSAVVAESSLIEVINSDLSYRSNSLVGIDLTDSTLKLTEGSTATTTDRSTTINNSTITVSEGSSFRTYRLTGSGSVEAVGDSQLTVDRNLEVDGFVSLTDSSLSTQTATVSNGNLIVDGASSYTSESLALNNSDMDLSGETEQKIDIGELAGENVEYRLGDTEADITIGKADVTNLTLHGSGNVNDATSGNVDRALTEFGVSDYTGSENVVLLMDEGMYEGETSAVVGVDGVSNVSTKTNTLMQSNLELASAAPLALNRIMLTDLRKRMGDIRSDEGNYGVWARYDGGRLSGSNGLESNFRSVHIGGDAKLGQWRLGAGFSYTNGDVDYARGDADMDAYGLELYGMWLGESGQFVDIVARVSSADTDMQVDANKSGSMDTMAYSLSAELGWRFDLTNQFYIEPQVEAAYTYVDTDDLSIAQASYEFDTINSLIGRAGFAAGIQFPEKIGDLYVHASVVHEFSGDAEITGGNGSTYSIDGKDTWCEFGVGASFHLTDTTYMWADLQRTSGAVLDEDWRANVGVRYSF